MRLNTTCIILFALLNTACAPLQQAPLVYASKTAVGIDISGTSTESPGVSLTVGWKQVDAAYVPVAVAKPCDTEASIKADCTKDIYKLQVVSGTSLTEGARRSGPSEEEAKETIKKYDDALKRVSIEKSNRDQASSDSAVLQTRKAELDTKLKQIAKQQELTNTLKQERDNLEVKKPAISDDEAKRMAFLDNQIKSIALTQLTDTDKKDISEIDARITDANNRIKKASESIPLLEAEANTLKPKAKEAEQLLDKLTKSDSFSVYGRFEANASGEPAKASVGLGKVFSTGVASQNISLGLSKYYENLGTATCYEAVAKLSETIKDVNLLTKFVSECKTSKMPAAEK